MWRHWSRGFKKCFKKSLNVEKRDHFIKDSEANHQLCCIAKLLLPRTFQHFDPCFGKQVSEEKKDRPNNGNSTRNIGDHTFFEAFGWSGALVFAWIISKQWWLKQKWIKDRESSNNIHSVVDNPSLFNLLAYVVKTRPPANYVLPILPQTFASENEDDEFEGAAKELLDIHEQSIGLALNRRGISYLSKTPSTEAIKYFKRASELKYPPASFNVGQCYELGIGTKQDFKKAAEWYKIASDQGHATAMYNLGVFYVHGWGGLSSDIIIAKSLFMKAADLGQPEAKLALNKEAKMSSNLIDKVKRSQIPILNEFIKPISVTMQSSELDLFVNKYTYQLADCVFNKECGADSNWDVPFKKRVEF